MARAYDLTLVLVSFHSEAPLRRFFASLDAHPIRARHEVIVADNAPGDGTADWLREHRPDVRVVAMSGNQGYARAVNAAIAEADGEHVLVINPDVELAEGAVDRALDYLRSHPEVGLVGVQLLDPDGSVQRNARRFYSLTTILLRRTPLGKLRPDHPELRRHLMLDDDLEHPGPVDWVTGAFMLVRREALDDVGAMDGRFFLYFEDVDWCYRMWEGGWEVHLVPDVRLVHEFQRTSTKFGRSFVHHLRSFVSFYDKWGALIYVARRLQGTWRTAAAVFGDLVALNLAFLAAFYARRAMDPLFPQPLFDLVHYWPLILSVNAVSLVVLPLVGRYHDQEGAGPVQRGLRELRATFFVTLVVMAGVYLSYTRTFSRAVILLFVPAYVIALGLVRAVRDRVLGGLERAQPEAHRALVLGPAADLPGLLDALAEGSGRDRVAGVVIADGAGGVDDASERRIAGHRLLGGLDDLDTVVDRYRIGEVLVAGTSDPDAGRRAVLRRLAADGIEVLVDQPWAARLGPAEQRTERWGHRWWRLRRPPALSEQAASKWLLDHMIGAILALVALPGHLLCSILGRPFGVRGRRVEVLGQRRRRVAWTELMDRNGRALPGLVQAPLFAAVAAGRLSLVGPFPLPLGTEEELGSVGLLRFAVKPGLTGPWRSRSEALEVGELEGDELEYIEHWSLARDVGLFLNALPRLLLDDERWPRVVSTR